MRIRVNPPRLLCGGDEKDVTFLIIFLIIIGKIFYLGIIDNEAPLKFSAGKSNPFVLSGERGNIYDTNGEILATSVKYPSIFINPRQIKNKDKDKYAKILSKELSLESVSYTHLTLPTNREV